MLTSKRFRTTKDGMCRRIAARLDAHHRRIKEQRSHDTPREVSCSSFAFMLKGGDFQDANSYRVSIVAKSPRGCVGILRGDFARWRKETTMNETEANGVGDYKLKRRGEPTGFMKRFKETPLVIVASRVRARARRTCIAAKK